MVLFLSGLVGLAVLLLLRWYVLLLWRAFPVFRDLIGRSTVRPGRVSAGPVEVSGRLVSETPIHNRRGRSCALVQVEIHNEWLVHAGKASFSQHSVRQGFFCAPGLSVRDASGLCRLEATPEHVALSANPNRQVYEAHEQEILLFHCPAYRPLVVSGARLTVIERSIRNKSQVIVTGQALLDEQAEPEGYRQGAADAFKIAALPQQKILVSPGTQGQAFARLSAPLILGFVVLSTVGYLAWLSLQLVSKIGM